MSFTAAPARLEKWLRRVRAILKAFQRDLRDAEPGQILLCAVMGCELKDEPFADLWNDRSRMEIENLLKTIAEETVGLVANASGETEDGRTLDLELLLLPLGHRGRMPARLLGALTPLRPPYWAGVNPIVDLSLGQYRHLGPAVDVVSAPHFRAVPAEQTDRRGFVLLQGGRTD